MSDNKEPQKIKVALNFNADHFRNKLNSQTVILTRTRDAELEVPMKLAIEEVNSTGYRGLRTMLLASRSHFVLNLLYSKNDPLPWTTRIATVHLVSFGNDRKQRVCWGSGQFRQQQVIRDKTSPATPRQVAADITAILEGMTRRQVVELLLH